MKKNVPYKCQKKVFSPEIAAIPFVVAVILAGMMIGIGMPVKETIVFFIFAFVIDFLQHLSVVKSNAVNRKTIEHYEKMIACPYVQGEVLGCIKYSTGGHELSDQSIRIKHPWYRLQVAFEDPKTGEKKTIRSELYAASQYESLNVKKVRVHYSDDGQYLVDLIR